MRRLLKLARKVLNRRWQPYPNVGHANAITSWENMVDALEQIVAPPALPAPPAPPVLQGKRAQPSTHDFNHIVTDVIILLLCIIFFFIMRSYILHILFVSSVRSSSVYHGLLEGSAATFSNFSNSSDSKVKVKVKGPNMSYIFEKHWIQGYRI